MLQTLESYFVVIISEMKCFSHNFHVVPNLYDFISSVEQKKIIFWRMLRSKKQWATAVILNENKIFLLMETK